MSPEITAAWIAAGVGAFTVAATVAAQYFGRNGPHALFEAFEFSLQTGGPYWI